MHKQENSRIMKENVMLLQEINVLRKDVHELNKKLWSSFKVEKLLI